MVSNWNSMIGTREPTGGDNVRDGKRTKTQDIPLLVVEKNGMGRTRGQIDRSERVNDKNTEGVAIAAHPKKHYNGKKKT